MGIAKTDNPKEKEALRVSLGLSLSFGVIVKGIDIQASYSF
jgi:hypothetical protein